MHCYREKKKLLFDIMISKKKKKVILFILPNSFTGGERVKWVGQTLPLDMLAQGLLRLGQLLIVLFGHTINLISDIFVLF